MKVLLFALTSAFCFVFSASGKMKALIIDGQNNHAVWPKSTVMMKQYLENSGLFQVEVARSKFIHNSKHEGKWLPLAGAGESQEMSQPTPDPDFSPDFSKYNLVVSNFGFQAANWPEKTQKNLEEYMKNGGGLVIVHAANNTWFKWSEFSKMIALGWGPHNGKSDLYVYYNAEGEVIRDGTASKGSCHGPRSEFLITMRDKTHPIVKGLPEFWMHTKDECYSHLNGPAENMTILATAADTPELQAAGRNEPMLMVINYEKGRVFHTTLGHDTDGFESVGFIVTFLRGSEWAATGNVTQAIPEDFPSKEKSTKRTFKLKE